MGEALEYYDDFSNSDGVGASANIFLQDGDSDSGVDYGSELPSAVGASDGADVRGGYGSREN